MKNNKKENILIAVSALRKIMEIFFGPFLIAYFIKTSKEGLIDLSIFNMMTYFIIGCFGLVVSYIIRNKFQIGMFRIGVVLNFFYILSIILLKEKILNHLLLVSFLYGVSAICYWFPYNLFIANQIENKSREEYEIKRKTVSLLVSILTPIILGSLITVADFQITAIVIAILSFIQIILSFFIKPKENKDYNFTLVKSYQKLRANKEIHTLFKVEFLKGFNLSDAVLTVIITVLILNAFKTDMNLGLITSISSAVTILLSFLYSEIFKKKEDKLAILICSIIPMLCLLLLLLVVNDITLIIYHLGYNIFINILTMIMDIRLFNLSNIKLVKEENEIEFWAIREVILNIGRVLGYLILFFLVFFKKDEYLNYLMIFLTLTITYMGFLVAKISRHNQ